MQEAVLTFIYKTIRAYSQLQEYIRQKLKGNNEKKDKKMEGYLIKTEYINYWIKYSDYDDLKSYIQIRDYQSVREIIYKYRKSNKYQQYQEDAIQYEFKSPEDFYKAIKKNNESYTLIDNNFWILICTQKGLKERGKVIFSLEKNIIKLYFDEFDYCQIITDDNIIDASKEIRSTGFDVVRKSDREEKELQKILLLYAYEQEIKGKINNLKYRENQFNKYYLISEEWISKYKKFYHYNEISKMIQGKEELKDLLNNGFDNAKKNLNEVLKHISFKQNSIKKIFPEDLKDNNTFLCEREDAIISKKYKVSYWRNFELVNEELKDLFMSSEAHEYVLNGVSDAKCLFTSGKIIVDLCNDYYNENIVACEIGTINNFDMLYNDEYIFIYNNIDAMIDNLSFASEDFLNFQRDYLNIGESFENDLYSKEGETYGIAYKIPPHE